MRFPQPLQPGATIGITAPSSGIPASLMPRFGVACRALRSRGYNLRVGRLVEGTGVVAAAEERAAELTALLADPDVHAVIPPWGGELAIQLLDHLDWGVLEKAEPTWLIGSSDLTTLMLPLATRLGWASLHGANLMDTPYDPPAGLLHWTNVAASSVPFAQRSPDRYRSEGWDDYETNPEVTVMTLDHPGRWDLVGVTTLDVTGRLIGGCIEVLSPLVGTPYADVAEFGRRQAPDGLIVYVEAAEDGPFTICRALHGMRMAGWFDHAHAVLVGRTPAPDLPSELTQREAVLDALGPLEVPIVFDVECGHMQPFLPLVNGAIARVVVDREHREITQSMC